MRDEQSALIILAVRCEDQQSFEVDWTIFVNMQMYDFFMPVLANTSEPNLKS